MSTDVPEGVRPTDVRRLGDSPPVTRDGAAYRPQDMVFSFFGGVVRGRDLPPIPTAVFLRLFGGIGVAEAATRATLARMTRKGLLERIQVGRGAHYRITPMADAVIRQAAERITAPNPFEHPDGEWTLLSYSMPESRRDLRHRVRSALTWAGFGGLRDGLWVAPGIVDVAEIFAQAGLAEVAVLADWFSASPLPGVQVEAFIRRAWQVDRIRERHDSFIHAWWAGPDERDPLVQITLLGVDWLHVLRADPGLPARYLGADWPAATSAAVFHRCFATLLPAASQALEQHLALSES